MNENEAIEETKCKSIINLVLDNGCNLELDVNKDIAEKIKELNNIKVEDITLNLSKVEDVYRYLVFSDKTRLYKKELERYMNIFKKSNYKDRSAEDDKEYKTIVLLLESPHSNEYDLNGYAIAPAQGETGRLIDINLLSMLKDLSELDRNLFLNETYKYKLIIANPIQYQTSLYMYNNNILKGEYKTLRNKCWRKTWEEKKIKDDFGERMKAYKPSLIINACTSDLQKKLQIF